MKSGAVFLVGPMGAGKSTIGRLLADTLRFDFRDVDREIEERSGVDIPWIFDMEGEEGFRDREETMLSELSDAAQVVISTGGGAVLRSDSRKLMVAKGTVIYLKTSVDEQIRRTARDRKRPLLQTGDPAVTLRNLMALREPLYEEIADYTVLTDNRTPKSVVQELCSQLGADDLSAQY
ncbi:shikimate kinase AroK [Zhongshania sp. BJYM1]|jgi:shikimate kinase|uniref:shikimate kinase AroK n=1 Tax=Zhongshania aquatica TaxID=2965069 RepID=UPI0022B5D07F|nr:shikimate kinase AroK [Marortus sp. BJYM1]